MGSALPIQLFSINYKYFPNFVLDTLNQSSFSSLQINKFSEVDTIGVVLQINNLRISPRYLTSLGIRGKTKI